MKRKFVWLIVSGLMVAALVLASCAPAVVEEKEAKVVTKEPEKKAEKVEEVVAEKTIYGGTITTILSHSPHTFDPLDGVLGTSFYTHPTQDRLVMTDLELGRKMDKNPYIGTSGWYTHPEWWKGNLVESWEQPDPYTAIFNIRPGIRWQNRPPANGRELTADDVVWNYQRWLADPRKAKDRLQRIESVSAPDKYTVVFKIAEPHVDLFEWIALGLAIQCPDVMDTYGPDGFKDWRNVMGTGPFMLTEYIPDVSATYERNPDYHVKSFEGEGVKAGMDIPFVDGSRILIITDRTTQIAALRTGKIDVTLYDDAITWDQLPSLKATNPELNWGAFGDGALLSLWFRSTKAPFNDVRVRKALSMVTNRQEINEVILEDQGLAYAWPCRPEWACFTPLEESPPEVREIYEFKPENIEKAKALLAEAGYPNGFQTSVQFNTGGKYQIFDEGMELLKEYWALIGVDVELRPVDLATAAFLRRTPFPYDDMLGVMGGQHSPLILLDQKFRTGGVFNRGFASDSHIDAQIDILSQEYDLEKRNKGLADLYNYVALQCFSVTMPRMDNFTAFQPWVKNYYGEAAIGSRTTWHIYAHAWIDRDLKEEITGRR